ncbi:MAG: PAS domain S-box protein [Alphaproteobacteria bacterium]|nr:PAS domain S-box protein [Alphaproteobacteria bacterium]
MFSGIRGKLVVLVLLIFGPALCLNIYFTWALRDAGKSEAMAQALRSARMATENQSEEIEGTRQLLITLSKISRIRQGDHHRCERLLGEIMNDTDQRYINLMLIDRMGQIICKGKSVSYDNAFAYHSLVGKVSQIKNLVVRKFPLDRDAQRVGIIFAYPIVNFSGKISGALAAVVDEGWIERLENDIPLPAGAMLTILDEYGTPLPNRETRSGNRSFLPAPDVMVPILTKGQNVFEGFGRDGIKRIYALSPVAKANHRLFWCVALSSEALFSKAERLFVTTLAVLLLSGLLVLLGAWGISNRMILRPLKWLVEATRHLAEGRLNLRIGQIAKSGELAELASAFDRMAASLEQREQALERSRKRLADILAIAHEPIISLDDQFRIRFFNPAAQKTFCYNVEHIIGESLLKLFPETHQQIILRNIKDFAFSQEISLTLESDILCIKQTGEEFPVEISLSKLKIGQEILYTLILRDITERKRAAEARARWNAELERSNAELEHFAYNVSHDLQEPLRMLASYTRLIQNEYGEQLDDRGNEFLKYAVDGATRLQKMIRDLLTYARVGRPGIQFVAVNCQQLVDQIKQDLLGLIKASGAELSIGQLPTITGNETELRQIFQNLLVNALKFHGDSQPIIEIACHEETDYWEFYVKDNGIGIDPRFKERIFGLFQRLNSQESFEGTGIGLALCRKIIDNLGGKIWVESTLGQGATFYFRIPKNQEGYEMVGDRIEAISY